MSADALDIRMAHLEGAYEQIDRRMGALEAAFAAFRHELQHELDQFRQEAALNMRWLAGIMLTSWLTLMLAIFLRR